MSEEPPEQLFYEAKGSDGEPQSRTWKEDALEEDRAKLHEAPADQFDRLDDQAQQTMGMNADLASGMSRSQASRHQTAEAARRDLENKRQVNAENEAARQERIQRERLERTHRALLDSGLTEKSENEAEKQ